jgi:hypothetical protein
LLSHSSSRPGCHFRLVRFTEKAERFVGTWRLVSVLNSKGEIDSVRGPKPTGLIIYDAHGNFSVQIMPDRERPKYALNKATPAQAQAALLGYTAYFGTYSIDTQTRPSLITDRAT